MQIHQTLIADTTPPDYQRYVFQAPRILIYPITNIAELPDCHSIACIVDWSSVAEKALHDDGSAARQALVPKRLFHRQDRQSQRAARTLPTRATTACAYGAVWSMMEYDGV